MNRSQTIVHYQENPEIDVLIIGAGINGSGTFRDLALQGVDVLLVERDDMCAGASSASSHMVHGGIRYLENGEFRLVREAVKERNRLIKNAPHYVHPLPTTIPIFKWGSGLLNAPLKFLQLLERPSERGAIVIKLGLMMYDAYTGGTGTVPKHDFNMRSQSLAKFPQLNPDILCTATYYDAAMPSPERICMEVILDGVAAHEGANFLNYMPAVGAEGGWVTLRDRETEQEVRVKPRLVINAAGPWIDLANKALGTKTKMMGGTKGSHIVVDNQILRDALQDNEIFFENEDGRIVLVYPFKDKVLIGTSDIRIEDPDEARCTPEEIDYFLGLVKKVFPEIEVTTEQIVFRFSGVRPLPYSDAKRAGQISRDHSIEEVPAGTDGLDFPIYALVGGKWTTFRAFSEQTANKTLSFLGKQRIMSTEEMAIGGGRGYPMTEPTRRTWLRQQAERTGVDEERLAVLFERYGTRAAAVADYIGAQAERDRPLVAKGDFSRHEIAFLAEHEHVRHLDDLLLRRSLLGMLGFITKELVDEVMAIVAPILGWDEARVVAENGRLRQLLHDEHALTLE